ncbi:hypothetical protein [Roseofilum casamattae]|uniref:hypothetical protein n=1 Tax=Roseofilum casamattae TaxID=3082944 RepID=UPI0024BE7D65|nr:hypothetical protein [Roseofilum casamattae]
MNLGGDRAVPTTDASRVWKLTVWHWAGSTFSCRSLEESQPLNDLEERLAIALKTD